MAKSLRSKQKRKFRALKREKNAPRELAKLKKVLGKGGKLEPDMFEMVKGKRFDKSLDPKLCNFISAHHACDLFSVSNAKTKEDQERREKEDGMIKIY